MIEKNIKDIIKNEGYLSKAIAKKAGYTEKAFSAMLNGRKVIRDVDIYNISEALHVSPNDLFNYQK